MSRSNWVGDNRDISPNRNDRYHIDNVGLQIGLGLPLQVIGVVGDFNRSRSNGSPMSFQRWLGLESNKNKSIQNITKDGDIRQTVDGIPVRKVYITNICIEVQRQEIYDIFDRYGPIINVYLGVSKNDNSKQFAFITYEDPRDAARVLNKRKFQDARGLAIYANAADSWHQPKEGPNGQIVWKVDRRTQAKQEEENEEDDEQVAGAVGGEVQTVIASEEGLNVLNDDCLMHIFSFLSLKEIASIERVCKRWQVLSYSMWRCLHELNFNTPPFNKMKPSTPALEQYLRRCGDALSLLDLTINNHAFDETTLAVIAKFCCNLEILRVSNVNAGNRSLAHLGRQCPKLKQLVMDGCTKYTDKDMMSLLPKCLELNHLALSHSNGIIGKCLVNVNGPISSLRLCNCPSMESKHLIAGLEKMSNTLQSLTLSACGNLCIDEVDKIVSAVPNLTSISLCRCLPQFGASSLSPLGKLTKLTALNLNLNSAVNDTILRAIVEGCEQLSSVSLSGSGGGCAGVLSDVGLSMLSRLRKLIDLDISYLEVTNNTALKNISTRSTRLKRLICRGCPNLSDDGSIPVITMCNDLELFDMSGCNNVGEKTVSAAHTSVKMRTNNTPLKLIVGGTNIQTVVPDKDVPLLTVDLTDLSEEHLRPDFIDDMFFPPSDSDDEEDLDHLSFLLEDVFGELIPSDVESDDYDTDDYLSDDLSFLLG